MDLHKLILIKKLIEKKLSDLDLKNFIKPYEKQLAKIINTPADEYSLTGNIEKGIENLLEAITNVQYVIGYQYSKEHTYEEILKLFSMKKSQLNSLLNPPEIDHKSWSFLDEMNFPEKKPSKKHLYDCKLTNEDWGSKGCICPGAYIYRKYLGIGLSEEEAKLIVAYCELGNIMEKDYEKAKELYEKYRFLKINVSKKKQ